MNTTLEYSTRVVQEGDRRCKKSTLNDLAYLTPLRIPLMNPVFIYVLSMSALRRRNSYLEYNVLRHMFEKNEVIIFNIKKRKI
jgi:hypothetical protein